MSHSVIKSTDYELNLTAGPSPFTGNTPLKVISNNLKYNKRFIDDAIKWVAEWSNERRVDYAKYPFLELTRNHGCVWQIDFYQTESLDGPHICLYGIYLSSDNRKILQAAVSLE